MRREITIRVYKDRGRQTYTAQMTRSDMGPSPTIGSGRSPAEAVQLLLDDFRCAFLWDMRGKREKARETERVRREAKADPQGFARRMDWHTRALMKRDRLLRKQRERRYATP